MELNLQISSQEDSPANRSRSQENKKEQVTTDISGQRCFESSKSLPRGGLLEKMSKVLLTSKTAWSSRMCVLTWKEKDTKSGRSIFQLQASAPRTEEKESGLWRTPDAVSGGSNLPGIKRALDQGHLNRPSGQPIQIRLQDQVREKRLWPTPTQDAATDRSKKYKQGGTPLSLAAKMWPTPNARDWKDSVNKVPPSVGKTRGHSLGMKVAEERQKMWPTPTSTERSGINPKTGTGAGLSKTVKMWPTPRAALGMTFKLSQGLANLQHKKYLETEVAYVEKAPGGTLNPTWVEWLMGYPAEYTDLKDWEILSSRKSRKKSATPSSQPKEKKKRKDVPITK